MLVLSRSLAIFSDNKDKEFSMVTFLIGMASDTSLPETIEACS